MITILDCYTDEPSGLGVPPSLGTYPRYIAGSVREPVNYITIDDLRIEKKYNGKIKEPKPHEKTNISTHNLTNNHRTVASILENTKKLIIVLGVHTPGKYLSAVPGTLRELSYLLKDVNCEKILTGPAVYGTQLEGGKAVEQVPAVIDRLEEFSFSYSQIRDYSIRGASIIKQIPDLRIIEIETAKGCSRSPGCSFCTEPIKNKLEFRDNEDVISEISEFYNLGVRHFRLGKQSCFYSIPKPIELLESIRKKFPEIRVLHIDNVNPAIVPTRMGIEITKAIVKYCTPGNIAAFGIETFDEKVIKANNLNCSPESAFEAIKIINNYGARRGDNGMPSFLPGVNILLGLIGETKETLKTNMVSLRKILDSNLLLRRINIRQVVSFPNTKMDEVGNKVIKKNKKHYWQFRNKVRQEIDLPMLKKIVPSGTVLKGVRSEIYDGKTTFARQLGTYPLIIGVKQRIPLNKFYSLKITGHMLRSITGEVV